MSKAKEKFLKEVIVCLLRKTDTQSLRESYGQRWLDSVYLILTEPEEAQS